MMSKKLTTDEFKQRAKSNKYVNIIGEYINNKEKIKCKCILCGEEYDANPNSIIRGSKHQKCSYILGTQKRTKTTDEFKNELKNISPFINVIGEYKNAKQKIKCICVLHNEEFESMPTHLINGECGCKQCKSQRIIKALMKPHDVFVAEIKEIQPNIEIVGVYSGASKPVNVKCLKCDYTWSPVGGSLLSGFGCPKCSGRYKTTQDLIDEVSKINKNIIILGEYNGAFNKIKCKCKICGEIFYKQTSSLKRTGCPYCNMSHGELKIKNWLDMNSIEYMSQKSYEYFQLPSGFSILSNVTSGSTSFHS